jgi:radical SAM/Cys-rich protein
MSRILPTLQRRGSLLSNPRTQIAVLDQVDLSSRFPEALEAASLFPLEALGITVLQINVGKKCNQTCKHCHVDAGPDRTEVMPDRVVDAVLRVLEETKIPALDITGGAPELHPRFKEMVLEARRMGRRVMDRCNLTSLLADPYRDMAEFLARNQVEILASLPHFSERQTDAQRGSGIFQQSLQALRKLNNLGYGMPGSGLVLNLVTNPVGAFLPAPQGSLEMDWKREMERRHGISFNSLYTITNMPIARFLEYLQETGNLERYMTKLVNAFNPQAAQAVMCRYTLSVGWDGTLFDCDFNQMLSLPVNHGAPRTIFDFDPEKLANREIVTGSHCFGCAAGQGSSCGGAVV